MQESPESQPQTQSEGPRVKRARADSSSGSSADGAAAAAASETVESKVETLFSGGGHECVVCKKKFGFPSHLKLHMVTHLPEPKRETTKKFACSHPGCNAKYTTEKTRARHELHAHTPGAPPRKKADVPKKCPVCDMTLMNANTLNRHMKAVHEKVRVSCEYCTGTFHTKTHLKLHMVTDHPDIAKTLFSPPAAAAAAVSS